MKDRAIRYFDVRLVFHFGTGLDTAEHQDNQMVLEDSDSAQHFLGKIATILQTN